MMLPKMTTAQRTEQRMALKEALGNMYRAYIKVGMTPNQAMSMAERHLKQAIRDEVVRWPVKLMDCGCVSGQKHGSVFRCARQKMSTR